MASNRLTRLTGGAACNMSAVFAISAFFGIFAVFRHFNAAILIIVYPLKSATKSCMSLHMEIYIPSNPSKRKLKKPIPSIRQVNTNICSDKSFFCSHREACYTIFTQDVESSNTHMPFIIPTV